MNSFESRGVSFDIWSTLVKHNPGYKLARDEYIADVLSAPIADVRASVREVDALADERTEETGEQLGAADRLELIAERHGVLLPQKSLIAMANDIHDIFLEYPPVPNEPGIVNTLAGLAERKPIVLSSNTGFLDGHIMRRALHSIGILQSAQGEVFSNEQGVAKPDARIFHAAAKLLALSNEDVVHVGDNPIADYEGATRAGMKAVLLREDGGEVEDGVVAAPTIKDAVERGLI